MDYRGIYDNIILKANSESRVKGNGVYYERHHIIPKCMGGLNNVENLVLLIAREHYICHKLLVEIYPSNYRLKSAVFFMSSNNKFYGRTYTVPSREYERIRKEYIKEKDWTLSKETKGKISKSIKLLFKNKENHPKYNKPVSKETRNKLRVFNTGKKPSIESREKQSISCRATWNSDEFAEKREIQRERAIYLHKTGAISQKGKPSKKRGKPFAGDRELVRLSLKEYYESSKPHNYTEVKVVQYDSDMKELKVWDSHHDAANFIGGYPKRILQVCKNKFKTHCGFKWKYYEDKRTWD